MSPSGLPSPGPSVTPDIRGPLAKPSRVPPVRSPRSGELGDQTGGAPRAWGGRGSSRIAGNQGAPVGPAADQRAGNALLAWEGRSPRGQRVRETRVSAEPLPRRAPRSAPNLGAARRTRAQDADIALPPHAPRERERNEDPRPGPTGPGVLARFRKPDDRLGKGARTCRGRITYGGTSPLTVFFPRPGPTAHPEFGEQESSRGRGWEQSCGPVRLAPARSVREVGDAGEAPLCAPGSWPSGDRRPLTLCLRLHGGRGRAERGGDLLAEIQAAAAESRAQLVRPGAPSRCSQSRALRAGGRGASGSHRRPLPVTSAPSSPPGLDRAGEKPAEGATCRPRGALGGRRPLLAQGACSGQINA